MTFKSIIKSMRLRTLPLSESGVLAGLFIALSQGGSGKLCFHAPVCSQCSGCLDAAGCTAVNPWTIFFLIITAGLLQIVSNLSNELGDTLHGTDTDQRAGIRYSIQNGEMTIPEMEWLLASMTGLCCFCGLCLIWTSFGTWEALEPLVLLALGAAAVWAAMRYTLGKKPYGYRGLGDLFVFIFFGLVSVCGGYYVCTHDLTNLMVLLPGATIGFFSMAVLNVNNIRDMKTDSATRTTMALRMGPRGARIYQTVLIALGWAALILFNAFTSTHWTSWLFLLSQPLFILHLRGVWHREDGELDSMLPLLVMGTFVTVILYGIGLLF